MNSTNYEGTHFADFSTLMLHPAAEAQICFSALYSAKPTVLCHAQKIKMKFCFRGGLGSCGMGWTALGFTLICGGMEAADLLAQLTGTQLSM
jgi:hypothetical protein